MPRLDRTDIKDPRLRSRGSRDHANDSTDSSPFCPREKCLQDILLLAARTFAHASKREWFGPAIEHCQIFAVGKDTTSLLAGHFAHDPERDEMIQRLPDGRD